MRSPSHHFHQLLQTVAGEPEPQRLLFVFAGASLPPDATLEQRQSFEAGQGGNLTPLACVDKGVEELSTFDELVAESHYASPPWQVVFIAALSGRGGLQPSTPLVDSALQLMVRNVRDGRFGGYLALDGKGEPVTFS